MSGRQLRSLIQLQVLSRGVTFFLNRALLGLASPGAFGTAAIQFELLSSTILFLSREGVRNALLRVKPTKDGVWNVGNLSFLPLALGVPFALASSLGYARFAAHETRSQSGFYGGIALYALAAVMELWCEPMHNRAMAEMKTHIRVRAEGMGITAKTLITYLVLLYDSKTKLDGDLALIAFALGQLAYSLILLLVYLSHYGFPALLPASPGGSAKKGALQDGIFRLSLTMTLQSDQGGYALAVNYGSLIARIVFQPIEETSRIRFSKMLAFPRGKEAFQTASQALITILSIQTSLSLILLVFGTAYLPIVLPVLLPRQYLATNAPQILNAWVWYIPVLALNGVLEAFISSVSTPHDLNRQSWWMAAFSVIYMGAAIQLYAWQFGDASLVYANIINLSARIGYGMYFVSAFFTKNSARSSLSWKSALPGWRLCLVCSVSWAVVGWNGRKSDVYGRVARIGAGFSVLMDRGVQVHVAIGGVFGLVCLATWVFTEGRHHLVVAREHAKAKAE
ncbi:Oligosaccharide translocation protein RFT1 [Mycena sanguinolenta]|uniref:Man(5)GlcNAc(2)-PP-dolichol translocation protein RFT1 n=1 Tax=Mycena sanguinolenta TaxID=230812 RepID=A0A8H6YIB6_9AGAR|nr:Oligosaccharide translocation protein RFT1 [Mycena sanguinolenta]